MGVFAPSIDAQAAAKIKSVKVTNVAGKKLVLKKGKKFKIKTKVIAVGKVDKTLTYKSSNKKIASVSKKGVIKAKKNGTATITVKSVAKKNKKCSFVVQVGTPVKSITLDKTELNGKVGDVLTITATVNPNKASYKDLSYESSDEKIVTVDSKGNVTCVAEGTAKVNVRALDGSGKKATCTVTVAAAPAQNPTVNPEPTNPKKDEPKKEEPKKEDPKQEEQQKDLSYEGYTEKWHDDFDGDELNRDDWNVELHPARWVNDEWQQYVDSDDNIYVKNGKLYLVPIKSGEGEDATYTSGRVNTQGKHDYTYGMFEARVKVPAGKGYLPAFWMMPTDENLYGQWPRCGEIDAMEIWSQENNKVYGTIHYGNPQAESQGTYTLSEGNFTDEFHTFTCEWEPGKITWYVDGIKYHEESDWYSATEGQGTVSYPAPFDQPYYMILNLAVGNEWAGRPDENTRYGEENALVVDYVKVYQKDSYDENVTRPVKEVVLRDPDTNGNYINNGDFATVEDLTDNADWKFLTANGGEATAAIADGKIEIDTTNAGTVDYSVQLVQAGLPFEKGAKYKVTFDAYADEARTMGVAVKAPDRGYMEYMKSTTVSLGTTPDTYTYEFTMKSDSDANGRLEYNMGAAGSTAAIHINNVKVEKTANYDPTQPEVKEVLADGNSVYNGAFREGTGRMGYWDVEVADDVEATTGVEKKGTDTKFKAVVGESDLEDVKLVQKQIALEGGIEYAVSFDAASSVAKEIKVLIDGKELAVNVAAYDDEVSLTHYMATFTSGDTTEFSDIKFLLGGAGIVYLDNVRVEENKLIKNGSFDAGTTGYEFYTDSTASANFVVDSLSEKNAADITVNKTADEDYKIQLKQNNVKLVKDKWYKLVFKAKSSRTRKIRVIMQGGESRGWPVYSNDNIVSLTAGKDYITYTDVFKMSANTDEAAFLSICLGKVGEVINEQHRVCIDDISLEEIDALPEANTNILVAPAVENGSVNNWTSYVDGAASATVAGVEGGVKYTITNAGTAEWNIHMKQGVLLKSGKTYSLTYDVESTVDRKIQGIVQDNADSGTAYNGWENATVSLEANTKKSVSQTFVMPHAADASFTLSLGNSSNTTYDAHSVTITNVVLKEIIPDNLLTNADFAGNSTAGWGVNVSAPNTYSVANGEITIVISDVGENDWDVKLAKDGITLEAGVEYQVSFDIVSTESRSIKACMMSADYSKWYGGYGDNPPYALTANEKATVTYTVFAEDGDDTANFGISMGKIAGYNTPGSTITISNLKLVKK
jgi:beta-glucanase (GH16 family)/uncharacterized protein YjdB